MHELGIDPDAFGSPPKAEPQIIRFPGASTIRGTGRKLGLYRHVRCMGVARSRLTPTLSRDTLNNDVSNWA